MNIIWTAEARKDLASIRRFIARDSKFYAASFVLRLIERVERLASSPGQGHPVHEFPETNLREVHESPYRIIYGVTETEVNVVAVVHFRSQMKPRRIGKR